MKIRKKTHLHVVRDEEEVMINRLLTELNDEDNAAENEEGELEAKKARRKKTAKSIRRWQETLD